MRHRSLQCTELIDRPIQRTSALVEGAANLPQQLVHLWALTRRSAALQVSTPLPAKLFDLRSFASQFPTTMIQGSSCLEEDGRHLAIFGCLKTAAQARGGTEATAISSHTFEPAALHRGRRVEQRVACPRW
jgi:hypothetical protein